MHYVEAADNAAAGEKAAAEFGVKVNRLMAIQRSGRLGRDRKDDRQAVRSF
jgi:hypothetical protein